MVGRRGRRGGGEGEEGEEREKRGRMGGLNFIKRVPADQFVKKCFIKDSRRPPPRSAPKKILKNCKM